MTNKLIHFVDIMGNDGLVLVEKLPVIIQNLPNALSSFSSIDLANIADLYTQLNSIQALLYNDESNIMSLQSNLSALTTLENTIQTTINAINATINSLQTSVNNNNLITSNLQTTTADISTALTNTETQLNTLQNTVTNLQGLLNTVKAQQTIDVNNITSMQASIANILSEISGLASIASVTTLQTEVATLQTQQATDVTNITALETAVAAIQLDITTLATDATIVAIQTQQTTDMAAITALQASVANMATDATVSTIQTSLTAVQNQQTKDVSNITALQTQQTTDVTNIAALTTELTSIQTQLTADVTSLQTSIISIEYKQTIDETNITTLNTEVSTIQTKQVTDETAISTLNTNLVSVQTQQITDEAAIATLETDIANINTNITALTTTVNSIPKIIPPSIRGNKIIYSGLLSTFYITNFDIEMTYNISITGGTFTLINNTIIINPPNVAGNITLTVNGSTYTLTVLTVGVVTPSITGPIEGQLGVHLPVSVASTAFLSTTGGDSLLNTNWQIATDLLFTNVITNIMNDVINLTTLTAENLSQNIIYYIRAQYNSVNGLTSLWSDPISFQTGFITFPKTIKYLISPSTLQNNEIFCSSVALDNSGLFAIAGAFNSTVNNPGNNNVFLLNFINSTWNILAEIKAFSNSRYTFGTAVAISNDGTQAFISSWNGTNNTPKSSGLIYTYSIANNQINAVGQELQPLYGEKNAFYTRDIKIDTTDTYLLAGSANGSNGIGYVAMWELVADVWNSITPILGVKITGSNNMFGFAFDISNAVATVAVGAYSYNGNTGGVELFTNNNGTYESTAILLGIDTVGGDKFGYSVSMSANGQTIAIGAPGNNNSTGAAYIFQNVSGVWTQVAKVVPADALANNQVGYTIRLSKDGNYLYIGAPYQTIGNNISQGAIYIYENISGVWILQDKVISAVGNSYDNLGMSIDISANSFTVIAGVLNYNNVGAVLFMN